MIKTNKEMAQAILNQPDRRAPLKQGLEDLLNKGISKTEQGVFLNFFTHNISPNSIEASQDATGLECFINKFYVTDYADYQDAYEQAFLCLHRIWRSLENENCRLIVTKDEENVSIRFHKLRTNEIWLSADLEEYQLNGILYIDMESGYALPETFSKFKSDISAGRD